MTNSDSRSGCLPLFRLLILAGGIALAVHSWRLAPSTSDLSFRKAMPLVIAGVGIVMIGRLWQWLEQADHLRRHGEERSRMVHG